MEIVKKEFLTADTHLRAPTKSWAWQSNSWVRLLRRPDVTSGLLANALSRILSLPLLGLVLFYQKTLSPDHGLLKPWYPHGYCKFYPSCSEYTAIVLRKQGLIGIFKIIKRLINCRPGVSPAIDHPKL